MSFNLAPDSLPGFQEKAASNHRNEQARTEYAAKAKQQGHPTCLDQLFDHTCLLPARLRSFRLRFALIQYSMKFIYVSSSGAVLQRWRMAQVLRNSLQSPPQCGSRCAAMKGASKQGLALRHRHEVILQHPGCESAHSASLGEERAGTNRPQCALKYNLKADKSCSAPLYALSPGDAMSRA